MSADINKTRPASFDISYTRNGKEYIFTTQNELTSENAYKHIYLGYFSPEKNTSLPDGLEFNKEYCLKKAIVTIPLRNSEIPQARHFWDFFPFAGKNLREILSISDDAIRLADLINNGLNPLENNKTIDYFRCAVIEPRYEPFRLSDFPTPLEKIDCMLQIIFGLKQLTENRVLRKLKIVAHRDLKFSNVVVEKMTDGSRRIRIIDFPSIKAIPCNDTAEGEAKDVNRTQLGAFSRSNTAPEDVLRKYEISKKTDVFALGTMLAEIFQVWDYNGITNPLTLLFTLHNIDTSDAQECGKFFETFDRVYPHQTINHKNWLEMALSGHNKDASWNNCCPGIRTLFRAATVINPDKRITLDSFERGLKKIYSNLIRSKQEVFVTQPEHKDISTTYLLVDKSNLNSYIDIYINETNKIHQNMPNTYFDVIGYDCRHASAGSASPDPVSFESSPTPMQEAQRKLRSLNAVSKESMYFSELKRALYDLCCFLENKTNLESFSGDIHILAPEFPDEENTCSFVVPADPSNGGIGIRSLTGEDISNMFANLPVEVRIYVHSFSDTYKPDLPTWYTVINFTDVNPFKVNTLLPQPETAEEEPETEEPNVVEEAEPVAACDGFYIIGGKALFFDNDN